jgi:hypothetical protein
MFWIWIVWCLVRMGVKIWSQYFENFPHVDFFTRQRKKTDPKLRIQLHYIEKSMIWLVYKMRRENVGQMCVRDMKNGSGWKRFQGQFCYFFVWNSGDLVTENGMCGIHKHSGMIKVFPKLRDTVKLGQNLDVNVNILQKDTWKDPNKKILPLSHTRLHDIQK